MFCLHGARRNSHVPGYAEHYILSVVNYSMCLYSETVYSDKANEFVMSRYHVTVIYTLISNDIACIVVALICTNV